MTASETTADLEAFRRGYAHHGVRENRLQLVEAWLAETGGYMPYHTRDRAAYAILRVSELPYQLLHPFRSFLRGTPYGLEGVYGGSVYRVDQSEEVWIRGRGGVFRCGREQELLADGGDKSDDFDAVAVVEDFFGNGARGYSTWVRLADCTL